MRAPTLPLCVQQHLPAHPRPRLRKPIPRPDPGVMRVRPLPAQLPRSSYARHQPLQPLHGRRPGRAQTPGALRLLRHEHRRGPARVRRRHTHVRERPLSRRPPHLRASPRAHRSAQQPARPTLVPLAPRGVARGGREKRLACKGGASSPRSAPRSALAPARRSDPDPLAPVFLLRHARQRRRGHDGQPRHGQGARERVGHPLHGAVHVRGGGVFHEGRHARQRRRAAGGRARVQARVAPALPGEGLRLVLEKHVHELVEVARDALLRLGDDVRVRRVGAAVLAVGRGGVVPVLVVPPLAPLGPGGRRADAVGDARVRALAQRPHSLRAALARGTLAQRGGGPS
eukprot:1178840-Prorocentrum_minimum.AAC.3